ncbi:hypothetical protein [Methylobacterium pseudosasicola]|uniref:Uncharacterized protein n=1 Tax=Methylobacterium pseudosasicola TaxID=582667 RepID=A0A1I4KTR5_9HYPH|nr:hypothetical protein [Methylobacterium pseudosasicola]SFL82110.1 hypothetical protein SAMN05192568_1011135 [Methylobacterium pseudosasicola]
MSRYPPGAYTPGVGDPVPRGRRNPRRGYDAEGRETVPATIANSMSNGAYAIRATCDCGHEAEVSIDRFPPNSFVPDAGLRMRCEKCGRKGPTTAPAWSRVSDRP